MLLAGPANLGLLTRTNGELAQRDPISWTQAPAELAFCYPYLLALMPRTSIVIHSVRDFKQVQTLPLPQVRAHLLGQRAGLAWRC